MMTDFKPVAALNIPKVPLLASRHQVSAPGTPLAAALLHTIRERLSDVLTVPESSTLCSESKAKTLCQFYGTLIPEDKAVFLRTLSTDYNVNQTTILQLANQLTAAQCRGESVLLRSEDRLRHALIPRYQQLFTQISRIDNGVKFLVDLRTDLLTLLTSQSVDQDNAYLQSMNTCLRDLLALWFSVGFLQLERITWQSPGDMLQKISEYEAVHPIRNWTDLMKRVGPYRRCFIFTHNSMPREPVVMLHTALTNDISSSIQSIVTRSKISEDDGDPSGIPANLKEDPSLINTAIFYSITSTQRGLQGVEMGNYLIKSVVQELVKEFPKMHQFSSLSPIPGYRDWLLKEINSYLHRYDAGESPEQVLFLADEVATLEDSLGCQSRSMFDALRKALQTNSWVNCDQLIRGLKAPLTRLCARYLYVEKRRGFALNPVANFHLRNGAMLWRINWLADTSPRGLSVACGLMVNYRYYLDATETNSRQYMDTQTIPRSAQIQALINQLPVTMATMATATRNHSHESPKSDSNNSV